MKKIIPLLIVVLVLFTGCSHPKSNNKVCIDNVKSHLKQKYPDLEYKCKLIHRGTFFDHDFIVKVKVDKGENEGKTFTVTGDNYSDLNAEFRDNYFSYLIKDSYQKDINSYAHKYFDTYKLNASCDNYFENNLCKKSQYEEAKKSEHFTGKIVIVVKPTYNDIDEFVRVADAFIADVKKEGLKTTFDIYYLKNDIYDDIDVTSSNDIKKLYDDYSYQKRIFQTK